MGAAVAITALRAIVLRDRLRVTAVGAARPAMAVGIAHRAAVDIAADIAVAVGIRPAVAVGTRPAVEGEATPAAVDTHRTMVTTELLEETM